MFTMKINPQITYFNLNFHELTELTKHIKIGYKLQVKLFSLCLLLNYAHQAIDVFTKFFDWKF